MDYKWAAAALSFAAEWNGSGMASRDEFKQAKEIAIRVLRDCSIEWRLPDEPLKCFVPILVCREKEPGKLIVEQGHKDVGGWWKVYGTRVRRIVAWAPMPEPPKDFFAPNKDGKVLKE